MKRSPLPLSLLLLLALLLLTPAPAPAQITPESGYQAEELTDPDIAPMDWVSSMAYYDGLLIYAGNDTTIRAYDPDTGTSQVVADLSADPNFLFGPAGFLVSDDGYLYFGDNGNTDNVYRLRLLDPWPAVPTSLPTGASGSIFSFAQNPDSPYTIWFASADFGGPNMYLYEISAAFDAAALRYTFAAPHGGGSGPIIFLDGDSLLYGESVWGGDGYFHRLDENAARDVDITADYLTFTGGLAGAVRAFDGKIFVATGAGMEVYQIDGGTATLIVAITGLEAQSLAYDNQTLFVSLQKPWLDEADDGEISFAAIWQEPEDNNGDGGGGGGGGGSCFIRSATGPAGSWSTVPILLAGLLALTAVWRVVRSGAKSGVN